MDVPDKEYLISKQRTLESLHNDYKEKAYCCKRLPLLDIETDHIIPDELHLLLRITDVLLKNLIATAVASDKRSMKRKWKLLKGPMLNAVKSNIRRCGIPFDIWEAKENGMSSDKAVSYSFTSLVGYKKKNLLKFFPSKITLCQPSNCAKCVQKLWEVVFAYMSTVNHV